MYMVNKKIWGPTTWYFFHTLAEKIKEEHFNDEKENIKKIIKAFCLNLPCPDCVTHATLVMNSSQFKNIQTKEQLKLFLFNFHNHVNNRLRNPPFKYEDLAPKYRLAKLDLIIKKIIYIYTQNTQITALMLHSFYKKP